MTNWGEVRNKNIEAWQEKTLKLLKIKEEFKRLRKEVKQLEKEYEKINAEYDLQCERHWD